jgi:hypothetical protein
VQGVDSHALVSCVVIAYENVHAHVRLLKDPIDPLVCYLQHTSVDLAVGMEEVTTEHDVIYFVVFTVHGDLIQHPGLITQPGVHAIHYGRAIVPVV